jgi:CBS domain-containing protein
MRAGEVCTREVSTIERSASLIEAARRMRDEHIGSLVVVSVTPHRRVPQGILTDRDIVVGVLATDPDQLQRLDVGDVSMNELVTATEDEDLGTVLKRMRSFAVRRVPVVDAEGDLLGILSLDDVLTAIASEMGEIARLLSEQRVLEERRRTSARRAS